jgi:hypothetical protein
MAGHREFVMIPFYATIGRGDRFEQALVQIAPLALRYGATYYEIRRSGDDQYKFTLVLRFPDSRDFYAYWEGPEFIDFRVRYGTWFQKPVVYDWFDHVISGGRADELGGNGGNGHEQPAPEPTSPVVGAE